MAESIDPEKLVSVAQVAKEFGYSPNYFSNLAAEKKFKAWRIGNTWATTREIIESYIKNAPPAGRPKKTSSKRKSKKSSIPT